MLAESKIVSIDTNNFYVFSSRNYNSYSICDNEEKQFIHQKPIKILKNRMKMRNRSIQQEFKDKHEKEGRVRVFKVIEGRGGKGDFLALLLEHG